MGKCSVAVVILNYNGVEHLQRFLPGVVRHTDAEVVVADNGSTDGSVEWLTAALPQLRVIRMDKNYGFAEGYNVALRQVEADIYVLLNSDVETPAGWLQPLLEYMQAHQECVACQPKILSCRDKSLFEYAGAAGGYIDSFGYPFCRGRLLSMVERDSGQYDSVAEVFWATGACLMIRSSAYWGAGGLDGRFFAHQEEIDLCWRLKARGGSVVCVPQSAVYHVGAGTLSYESPRKTYLNFRNNALLLYKNEARRYGWVSTVRLFLDWTAALHMVLQGKPRNAAQVFKAQMDFFRMKGQFRHDREENLRLTSVENPVGVLNHLLLISVYLKGIKRYSGLGWK